MGSVGGRVEDREWGHMTDGDGEVRRADGRH